MSGAAAGSSLRGGDRVALMLVVVALGFIAALAWAGQTTRTRAAADRSAELARIAANRQAHTAALERELSRLRERAGQLAAGGSSAPLRLVNAELERFGMLAGTVPARGPGVAVVLEDSPLAAEDPAGSLDFRIQDIDIQLVVNELWHAGAEAVAVNGQRVVGTTAIRSAGEAILVNFKVLASPYRVEAIGPARPMRERFEASEVAQRFRKWTDLYRLGFRVRSSDDIRIPAYAGTLRFRHAHADG